MTQTIKTPTADSVRYLLIARSQSIIEANIVNSAYVSIKPEIGKIFDVKVVVPEQVIYECYKNLIKDESHVKFETRHLTGGMNMGDDVFSEYPCLLIGNRLVTKDNLGVFFKKVTDINDKFRGGQPGVASLEKIKRLELLCQTQLHLVTKYNYHMQAWSQRNALHYIFSPMTQLRNTLDMFTLKQMAKTYTDVVLVSPQSRFNIAKSVHDQLEAALTSIPGMPEKRTFFDTGVKEEEKEPHFIDESGQKPDEVPIIESVSSSVSLNPRINISSLDLTVYAYLREEIVNTPDSEEVKYLRESGKCPNLLKFYQFMDAALWDCPLFVEKNPVGYKKDQVEMAFNELAQKGQLAGQSGSSTASGKVVIKESPFKTFLQRGLAADVSESESSEEDNSEFTGKKKDTPEEKKQKKKEKKRQLRLLKTVYTGAFCASVVLYLNFGKNPFN